MKRISYIFILLMTVSSYGQSVSDPDRPLKRKAGIMRYYTGLSAPGENTAEKYDRLNSDFFYNTWLGDVNDVSTKFYALGHNINLMFDIPFSKTSRMGIGIGFGYSHFNVRHEGGFSFIDEPTGNSVFTSLAPYTGPKRWINRTVFNFIEVPFEIRFRSQKERGKWKFYPGFKAGFMVENYSKWRVEHYEYKEFNFPDLNRIHYGPTVRIGRDNLMLFGYYDMTTLFTNTNSNKLQLIAVGISIGWF
ncbi:MAG: hypothetical protein GQ574_15630 [Crocinitomix sp.]|nr:hypothetical protein [Crocinitomix sp.]